MHRLLIAATAAAAFAVAACGGSTSNSSTATSPAPSAAKGPKVRLVDFSLQPGTLSAATGTTIEVVNAGKSPHNLWIRDASGKVLAKTSTIEPGQQATLRLDLPAGAYTDYCQEPGHESLGMKGTLTVT